MPIRNEDCIREWAALIMNTYVYSLNDIQYLPFLKRVLFRIDPKYFQQYANNSPATTTAHTFADVFDSIVDYYRVHIKSNIHEQVKSLNVFRDVSAIWYLLFGIAIKGNNRDQNINIILQTDVDTQYQLMLFIKEILAKYGYNVSYIDNEQYHYKHIYNIEEIIYQRDYLSNTLIQLQMFYDEERRNNNLTRKYLEDKLELLKRYKLDFLEIMANMSFVNIDSKALYEDNEVIFSSKASLVTMGKDILQFISEKLRERKMLQVKVEALEEKNKELKKDLESVADDLYVSQENVKDLYRYYKEIITLRNYNISIRNYYSKLLHKLADMYLKSIHLMERVSQKALKDYYDNQRRKKKHFKDVESIEVSSQINYSYVLQMQTTDNIMINQISSMRLNIDMDEGNQQTNKRRLQREIKALNKIIQYYKYQNNSLKQANETLYHSTQAYLLYNQRIFEQWESDYVYIIAKMQTAIMIDEYISDNLTQTDASLKDDIDGKYYHWKDIMSKIKYMLYQHKHKYLGYQRMINRLMTDNIMYQDQLKRKNYVTVREYEAMDVTDYRRLKDMLGLYSQYSLLFNGETDMAYYKNIYFAICCKNAESVVPNKNVYYIPLYQIYYKVQVSGKYANLNTNAPSYIPAHIKSSIALHPPPNIKIPQVVSNLVLPRLYSNESSIQISSYSHSQMQPILVNHLYCYTRPSDPYYRDYLYRRNFYGDSMFRVTSEIVNNLNLPAYVYYTSYRREHSYLPSFMQYRPIKNCTVGQLASMDSEFQDSLIDNLGNITRTIKTNTMNILHYHSSTSQKIKYKLQLYMSYLKLKYAKIDESYVGMYNKLKSSLLKKHYYIKWYQKYDAMLEEISNIEKDGRDMLNSSLVQLKIINDNQKRYINSLHKWKQEILNLIGKLKEELEKYIASRNAESIFLDTSIIGYCLAELNYKYVYTLQQPFELLAGLDLPIRVPAIDVYPSDNLVQIDQLRMLYVKYQYRNHQLNYQIEIMASVLLYYRNMLDKY